MQTTTVATQNAVDGKNIGVATGSITFFRQMGGTFGVAVFMSILFSQLTSKVVASFESPEVQAGIASVMNDREALAEPRPSHPEDSAVRQCGSWRDHS